jgi:hypothetical protein
MLSLLIAAVLFCWGLWGDRSRGRPRCPNCWYDMRGTVPKLVCPKCGHAAGEAGQLYYDRVRPWMVALAVVLVLTLLIPCLFYTVIVGFLVG